MLAKLTGLLLFRCEIGNVPFPTKANYFRIRRQGQNCIYYLIRVPLKRRRIVSNANKIAFLLDDFIHYNSRPPNCVMISRYEARTGKCYFRFAPTVSNILVIYKIYLANISNYIYI